MNKKVIVSMSIGILTLLVLVIGATYAYFIVNTSGSANATITASTPQIGTVTISGGSNLSLNVTAAMMMKPTNSRIVYYASPSGGNNGIQTIATATVSGPGTYNCTGILNVKGSGNLLNAYVEAYNNKVETHANAIEAELRFPAKGSTYDYINRDMLAGKDFNFTLTNLTENNPQSITGLFYIINYADTNQNYMAGKSATLTFKITSFSCTAV